MTTIIWMAAIMLSFMVCARLDDIVDMEWAAVFWYELAPGVG